MPPPPADAKIYHIVHLDRLPNIIAAGGLFSDSRLRREGCDGTTIGMGDLKTMRLNKAIDVCPGTRVGDYVPFYFCSRSIMLYVIHMANHAALQYRGGQRPIVHLESSLAAALAWADEQGVQWAVSLGNATASYTEFRANRAGLNDVRWDLIPQRDFRDPQVKDAKQSEALFFDFFPWELIERVGAIDETAAHSATQIMLDNPHRPVAQAMRGWYY